MTDAVATVADDVHDALMAASPVDASLLGDHRFDTAVPDVSPAGIAATRRRLTALADRLGRIDRAASSTTDRVTLDVAAHAVAHATHDLDDRYLQTAAGPMTSGAGIGSAAAGLLAALPKLVLRDSAHAEDHLTRCRRIPGWLADAEAQLQTGVAGGCVPPARLVVATVRMIDRYLATDQAHDPLLLAAPPGQPDPRRWRTALGDVLATHVRPALRRHRRVLADDVAPVARPDDAVGLVHLPDGAELYADAVQLHTMTRGTPEQQHKLGLDLVAALAEEYRELGGRVLGSTDLNEILRRLRDDPALRFTTSETVLATAEASLRRAERAMGDWFDGMPRIPCEVRGIPALEAPESTIAYYQPPAVDGSRPGTYYVNTTEPHLRTRFEAEALAFHESVPGHHTQIATAMELDLPMLQRVHYLTAYAEGWALYVERLADQMGLYSDDVSRLGMLSFDSWRACRLVVDTGMHAFGWSRLRAVAYMRDNSPQAPSNIANEVDRYIGWPGQALAYMAGRIRIDTLRDRARRALGRRFDVAGFHRVVLGHGAVPLHTLGQLVDAWIRNRTA
ncbi:MAG TPA: DUF885 domain-containing protein [Euzebyales bacterium]|nr:DUF885 domain-containing protein [Euzebyales bacterium]